MAQWGAKVKAFMKIENKLLYYNKASTFVVCSRSVDCSRHNDEDDCDGQAASGPESQVNHARNPSSNDNLHGGAGN